MIEIIDNYLDKKHCDSLDNLHINYYKVHWYRKNSCLKNPLYDLISSTHYSDQLSGATAWYNIRPTNPQWHNDIDSYCTQNGIKYLPKILPEYSHIYYMRAPDSGGELELDSGDIIQCIPNRLVKFPCNIRHRVRPYKGNRVSIGMIWWHDLPEIYGNISEKDTAVVERIWEIEDARKQSNDND
jgi:hypothetical protein